MQAGCPWRYTNSDNETLRKWVSIHTAPSDILPICALVTNVRGYTERNRVKRSPRPPLTPTMLEKEQTLASPTGANWTRPSYLIEGAETLTHAL